MTSVTFTLGMGVANGATLMTMRNNILRNPLSPPVIKNKVLPNKFRLQLLSLDFVGIMNNSSFQVIHFFKTFVQHIGAGFFASDSARAIHHHIFIFLPL